MQRYMALAAIDPSIEGAITGQSSNFKYKSNAGSNADVPQGLIEDPAINQAVSAHNVGTKVIEITSGAGFGSAAADTASVAPSSMSVNDPKADTSKQSSKKAYIINNRGEKITKVESKGIYAPPSKGYKDVSLIIRGC